LAVGACFLGTQTLDTGFTGENDPLRGRFWGVRASVALENQGLKAGQMRVSCGLRLGSGKIKPIPDPNLRWNRAAGGTAENPFKPFKNPSKLRG